MLLCSFWTLNVDIIEKVFATLSAKGPSIILTYIHIKPNIISAYIYTYMYVIISVGIYITLIDSKNNHVFFCVT